MRSKSTLRTALVVALLLLFTLGLGQLLHASTSLRHADVYPRRAVIAAQSAARGSAERLESLRNDVQARRHSARRSPIRVDLPLRDLEPMPRVIHE